MEEPKDSSETEDEESSDVEEEEKFRDWADQVEDQEKSSDREVTISEKAVSAEEASVTEEATSVKGAAAAENVAPTEEVTASEKVIATEDTATEDAAMGMARKAPTALPISLASRKCQMCVHMHGRGYEYECGLPSKGCTGQLYYWCIPCKVSRDYV